MTWNSALCLCLLAAVPAAAATDTRMKAGFEPVSELASVAQLLAGGAKGCEGFVDHADLEWSRQAKTRFAKFKDHEAVKRTAALPQRGVRCVDRDLFLLQIDAPAALRPALAKHASNRELGDHHKEPDLQDGYLKALWDFAKAADFSAFLAEETKVFAPMLKDAQTQLDGEDFVRRHEAYTGLKFKGAYLVSPSPFYTAGGPVNNMVDLDDGGAQIYTLSGFEVVAGAPKFSTANIRHVVYHELSHATLDALAGIYADDLARSLPLQPGLKLVHYGPMDWPQAVREHVVRAVKNRLLALHYGQPEADRDLKMEVEAGFTLLPKLVERLGRYEADRKKFPDLTAFYPQLIAVFDEAMKAQGLTAAAPSGKAEDAFSNKGQKRRAVERLDTILTRKPDAKLQKLRGKLVESLKAWP